MKKFGKWAGLSVGTALLWSAASLASADDFTVDFRNVSGYGVPDSQQLQLDGIVVNFLVRNPLTGQLTETSVDFNVLWQWQYSTQSLVIASIPESCTEPATLQVNVTDALTGEPLGGVSLTAGNESATSDNSGIATFSNLEDITLEVTAALDGYVGTSQSVSVECGSNTSTGFSLLPSDDVGTIRGDIRINLTWQENPADLDAHLTGPRANASGENDRFHVYFSNQNNCDSSSCDINTPAWLDVDDTTSYGPENITIRKADGGFVPGTYRYSVYHYFGSSSIPDSGSTVKIYVGDTLTRTYNPTASSDAVSGWAWTVVEIVIGADGSVSFNETGTYAGPTDSFSVNSMRYNRLGRPLISEDQSLFEQLPAK